MNSHNPFKTFIATCTVFVFFFTSLGISPSAFASTAMPEVSFPYQIALDRSLGLAIPQKFGKLENFSAGQGDRPAIFHIQTAHGHYQAQQQIRQILQYLDKNYGVRTVLVEGSAFELDPELLNFFPKDKKLTLKVNDALTKHALVKGPELYLLESKGAKAYGVEDLRAYRENGVSFVSVLKEKQKTEQFLADMNMQIERLASHFLNKDLRDFLKRTEGFEKNQIPLDTWLANLKGEAQKRLEMDLTSPAYQLDWPMLVRVFKLQELAAKLDKQKFPKERDEFLKALRRFMPQDGTRSSHLGTQKNEERGPSPKSLFAEIERLLRSEQQSVQLPDPETGILFEDMVKQLPENFNYEPFPNVRYFIGTLLLQSELKADRLILEVQKLSNEIAAKLTRSKEEKKLVALLADHRLLQKLFALELTPSDYSVIAGARDSHLETRLKPSNIAERFQQIGFGSRQTRNQNEALVPSNESRERQVEFKHVGDLDVLFNKALLFYKGVKERDTLMMQRVEERLKETGATKVAVITGGFHSEPFHQYFTSKKYTYALISPSIAGADAEGHEAYINNMLRTTAGKKLDDGSRMKDEVKAKASSAIQHPLSSPQGVATYESVFAADRQVLASGNPYGIDPEALRTMVRNVIQSVTRQTVSGSVQEVGDGSAAITFQEAQDVVKARKAKARAQGSRGAWPSLDALFRDSSLNLIPVIAGSRLAENYLTGKRSEVRDQGDLEPGMDEESANVIEEAGTSLDDLMGELHAVADEDESDSGDARAEALQHIALIESAKHKNQLLPAIVDAQKFLRSSLASSRSEVRADPKELEAKFPTAAELGVKRPAKWQFWMKDAVIERMRAYAREYLAAYGYAPYNESTLKSFVDSYLAGTEHSFRAFQRRLPPNSFEALVHVKDLRKLPTAHQTVAKAEVQSALKKPVRRSEIRLTEAQEKQLQGAVEFMAERWQGDQSNSLSNLSRATLLAIFKERSSVAVWVRNGFHEANSFRRSEEMDAFAYTENNVDDCIQWIEGLAASRLIDMSNTSVELRELTDFKHKAFDENPSLFKKLTAILSVEKSGKQTPDLQGLQSAVEFMAQHGATSDIFASLSRATLLAIFKDRGSIAVWVGNGLDRVDAERESEDIDMPSHGEADVKGDISVIEQSAAARLVEMSNTPAELRELIDLKSEALYKRKDLFEKWASISPAEENVTDKLIELLQETNQPALQSDLMSALLVRSRNVFYSLGHWTSPAQEEIDSTEIRKINKAFIDLWKISQELRTLEGAAYGLIVLLARNRFSVLANEAEAIKEALKQFDQRAQAEKIPLKIFEHMDGSTREFMRSEIGNVQEPKSGDFVKRVLEVTLAVGVMGLAGCATPQSGSQTLPPTYHPPLSTHVYTPDYKAPTLPHNFTPPVVQPVRPVTPSVPSIPRAPAGPHRSEIRKTEVGQARTGVRHLADATTPQEVGHFLAKLLVRGKDLSAQDKTVLAKAAKAEFGPEIIQKQPSASIRGLKARNTGSRLLLSMLLAGLASVASAAPALLQITGSAVRNGNFEVVWPGLNNELTRITTNRDLAVGTWGSAAQVRFGTGLKTNSIAIAGLSGAFARVERVLLPGLPVASSYGSWGDPITTIAMTELTQSGFNVSLMAGFDFGGIKFRTPLNISDLPGGEIVFGLEGTEASLLSGRVEVKFEADSGSASAAVFLLSEIKGSDGLYHIPAARLASLGTKFNVIILSLPGQYPGTFKAQMPLYLTSQAYFPSESLTTTNITQLGYWAPMWNGPTLSQDVRRSGFTATGIGMCGFYFPVGADWNGRTNIVLGVGGSTTVRFLVQDVAGHFYYGWLKDFLTEEGVLAIPMSVLTNAGLDLATVSNMQFFLKANADGSTPTFTVYDQPAYSPDASLTPANLTRFGVYGAMATVSANPYPNENTVWVDDAIQDAIRIDFTKGGIFGGVEIVRTTPVDLTGVSRVVVRLRSTSPNITRGFLELYDGVQHQKYPATNLPTNGWGEISVPVPEGWTQLQGLYFSDPNAFDGSVILGFGSRSEVRGPQAWMREVDAMVAELWNKVKEAEASRSSELTWLKMQSDDMQGIQTRMRILLMSIERETQTVLQGVRSEKDVPAGLAAQQPSLNDRTREMRDLYARAVGTMRVMKEFPTEAQGSALAGLNGTRREVQDLARQQLAGITPKLLAARNTRSSQTGELGTGNVLTEALPPVSVAGQLILYLDEKVDEDEIAQPTKPLIRTVNLISGERSITVNREELLQWAALGEDALEEKIWSKFGIAHPHSGQHRVYYYIGQDVFPAIRSARSEVQNVNVELDRAIDAAYAKKRQLESKVGEARRNYEAAYGREDSARRRENLRDGDRDLERMKDETDGLRVTRDSLQKELEAVTIEIRRLLDEKHSVKRSEVRRNPSAPVVSLWHLDTIDHKQEGLLTEVSFEYRFSNEFFLNASFLADYSVRQNPAAAGIKKYHLRLDVDREPTAALELSFVEGMKLVGWKWLNDISAMDERLYNLPLGVRQELQKEGPSIQVAGRQIIAGVESILEKFKGKPFTGITYQQVVGRSEIRETTEQAIRRVNADLDGLDRLISEIRRDPKAPNRSARLKALNASYRGLEEERLQLELAKDVTQFWAILSGKEQVAARLFSSPLEFGRALVLGAVMQPLLVRNATATRRSEIRKQVDASTSAKIVERWKKIRYMENDPEGAAARAKAEEGGKGFLANAQEQIRRVAKQIQLNDRILERLMQFEKIIHVKIPLTLDEGGEPQMIDAWRIGHNSARGPYKGGIRYAINVTEGMIRALATEMSLKNGMGLPYGGGKGGVAINPRELSVKELARLTRGYVSESLKANPKAFGPLSDIPAGDIGTTSREMGWFADEFLKIMGPELFTSPDFLKKLAASDETSTPYLEYYMQQHYGKRHIDMSKGSLIATVTAKPEGKGGAVGRTPATGLGLYYVTREALKVYGERLGIGTSVKGQKVAVEAYGNVGSYAARSFRKDGAAIMAIKEFVDGRSVAIAAVKDTGINLDALDEHLKVKGNTVLSYVKEHSEDAREVTIDEFWSSDVTILALAAKEKTVNKDIAKLIRAKIVSEGANGPLELDGSEQILLDKGSIILADVFTNVGGVAFSSSEWRQNMIGELWPEVAGNGLMEDKVVNSFYDISKVSESQKITLREAAYQIAISRIVDAMLAADPKLAASFNESNPPYMMDAGAKRWRPETLPELKQIDTTAKRIELIERADEVMSKKIDVIVAEALRELPAKRGSVILIGGPRASGKPMLAGQIMKRIRAQGIKADVLDMDYQTVEDVSRVLQGKTIFVRKENGLSGGPFNLEDKEILVVHGYYALGDEVIRFINAMGGKVFPVMAYSSPDILLANNWALTAYDLRLMRDILTSVAVGEEKNALEVIRRWQWQRVSENEAVMATWKNAKRAINTYLPYELPFLKSLISPMVRVAIQQEMLHQNDDVFALNVLHHLDKLLVGVEGWDVSLLEGYHDSVLWEYVKRYAPNGAPGARSEVRKNQDGKKPIEFSKKVSFRQLRKAVDEAQDMLAPHKGNGALLASFGRSSQVFGFVTIQDGRVVPGESLGAAVEAYFKDLPAYQDVTFTVSADSEEQQVLIYAVGKPVPSTWSLGFKEEMTELWDRAIGKLESHSIAVNRIVLGGVIVAVALALVVWIVPKPDNREENEWMAHYGRSLKLSGYHVGDEFVIVRNWVELPESKRQKDLSQLLKDFTHERYGKDSIKRDDTDDDQFVREFLFSGLHYGDIIKMAEDLKAAEESSTTDGSRSEIRTKQKGPADWMGGEQSAAEARRAVRDVEKAMRHQFKLSKQPTPKMPKFSERFVASLPEGVTVNDLKAGRLDILLILKGKDPVKVEVSGGTTILLQMDAFVSTLGLSKDFSEIEEIQLLRRSEARNVAWTDVQGDIKKWLAKAQEVRPEDFNLDMFRDYDYRYVKETTLLKPEIVFILTLIWAKMALKKARAAGITTRDVLIARDARKIEPEIVDAEIAALRYAGLNVVFIGDEPNCVTSYSWAVQSQEWLMTIFNTASHVSQPEKIIVRGFKGTQLSASGGNLLSLTTKEIKNESLALVKEMLSDKTKIVEMKQEVPGKLTRRSVEADAIRFNTAVGLAAAQNESLFQLGRDIKLKESSAVVSSVIERHGQNKPLAGVKVVVEGFHTPSGPLAAGVFRNLGADVTALNTDVQEITGLHPADPSIEKNLETLKKQIVESHADFGIAFDLDGDRGAILIPEWNTDGSVKKFHMLSPDNLLGMLMPNLLKDWGYAASGREVGVIRDVLGTYGVNDSAQKNQVKMFQTDAGYVYLKKLKEEMEAKGYVFPVYGERSGHTWLNVSGEIENPVAIAVLFATIAAKNKAQEQPNGFLNLYQSSTVPYTQSPRFQPFYHPKLLQWLSEHNDLGWTYVPGVNPLQAIVALGKDETVKRLRREFPAGKVFGAYEVAEFNTYQDPADEGGLYRFADIMFKKDGVFVGRVVVRASSNDPTFVMSYEAPILEGQIEIAAKNRIATAGLVMQFMMDEGLGIFTRDQMNNFMGYLTPEAREVQFNKSNLGPVEADYKAFLARSETRLPYFNVQQLGKVMLAAAGVTVGFWVLGQLSDVAKLVLGLIAFAGMSSFWSLRYFSFKQEDLTSRYPKATDLIRQKVQGILSADPHFIGYTLDRIDWKKVDRDLVELSSLEALIAHGSFHVLSDNKVELVRDDRKGAVVVFSSQVVRDQLKAKGGEIVGASHSYQQASRERYRLQLSTRSEVRKGSEQELADLHSRRDDLMKSERHTIQVAAELDQVEAGIAAILATKKVSGRSELRKTEAGDVIDREIVPKLFERVEQFDKRRTQQAISSNTAAMITEDLRKNVLVVYRTISEVVAPQGGNALSTLRFFYGLQPQQSQGPDNQDNVIQALYGAFLSHNGQQYMSLKKQMGLPVPTDVVGFNEALARAFPDQFRTLLAIAAKLPANVLRNDFAMLPTRDKILPFNKINREVFTLATFLGNIVNPYGPERVEPAIDYQREILRAAESLLPMVKAVLNIPDTVSVKSKRSEVRLGVFAATTALPLGRAVVVGADREQRLYTILPIKFDLPNVQVVADLSKTLPLEARPLAFSRNPQVIFRQAARIPGKPQEWDSVAGLLFENTRTDQQTKLLVLFSGENAETIRYDLAQGFLKDTTVVMHPTASAKLVGIEDRGAKGKFVQITISSRSESRANSFRYYIGPLSADEKRVPGQIKREMSDEIRTIEVTWGSEELGGLSPKLVQAMKYWTPRLYTSKEPDVEMARMVRDRLLAESYSYEIPLATHLLKQIALSALNKTGPQINELTETDLSRVVAALRKGVEHGRSLQKYRESYWGWGNYDQLSYLISSSSYLKNVLRKLAEIYQAEARPTRAGESLGSQKAVRSEIRVVSGTMPRLQPMALEPVMVLNENDIGTLDEIQKIYPEVGYDETVAMKVARLFKGGILALRFVITEKLERLTALLERLGYRKEVAIQLADHLTPEDMKLLEGISARSFAISQEQIGKTLAGGAVFMDAEGLINFARNDSVGFYNMLNELAAEKKSDISAEKPLLTAGDAGTAGRIVQWLLNKNSGLTLEKAQILNLLDRVLEIKPVKENQTATINELAEARLGGMVTVLSSQDMLAGLNGGANFAFKDRLAKENVKLVLRALLGRMRALAAQLNGASAIDRVKLLEEFNTRRMGGLKKAQGGFVFDNILLLVQSFLAQEKATAKSA